MFVIMAKRLVLSFAFMALVVMSIPAQLTVGSYNIRYRNGSDSINGNVWSNRCRVICDQVNFISPDIFGAQEVLHGQLLDMLSLLDGYSFLGVGRDDGATKGEYAAIFYRPDRLRLLDEGHFWLSETPDRPGLGWDAVCVRICTWGKFAAQTATDDDAFFFFNLHMDHVGVVARREAARLVIGQIAAIAHGAPVILTGDFNVDQTDEIYRFFTESGLLKDSYHASRLRFAENGTFNSFDGDLFTPSRIDHVFVSPSIDVDAYGILTNAYWVQDDNDGTQHKGHDAPGEISLSRYNRRLPSDHYPVFVRLKNLK